MPDIPQDAVRDCIKSYLQTKGLSYQYIADKTGLSLHTVNNYMSQKPLSEKTIGKFAKSLDYPYELLLKGIRYYGPDAYKELEERVKRLEDVVFNGK